jgi:ATP-binding cassette subfamily B protein
MNITDNQFRLAADTVHASHFIDQLNKKYQTEVGERGSSLSVGQKQLLAFARALAFNPKILILDEATSSIDTETEILIRDALEKLIAGRTSIIIAHRLSTIQKADRIIVLHHGRIREIGAHQELLRLKGIYWKLYQLQYKDQINSEHIPAS